MISGKIMYSAADWAKFLLERLDIADWGLSMVIISDREKKLTSELRKALFEVLGV